MKTAKRILRITLRGLLIASIMCVAACKKDNNEDNRFYFDEKTFISERSKWEAQGIENYSFVMEWEYPDLYKYKAIIFVKNDVMDSFEYIDDVQYDYFDAIVDPEFTSISDMYQKIFNRAQRCKESSISTRFDLEYDENSNFIKSFRSDAIVDHWAHTVIVSEFTIINAD